jgi:hypothetical protein
LLIPFPDGFFGGTAEVPPYLFMASVTGVAIHFDIFRPFSFCSVPVDGRFLAKIEPPRGR